ncbi:CRISPR-associated helicase Cas3' [Bacillota bacterium Meth-B3]
MFDQSTATLSLWAKKARDGNPHWLPLVVHLADSAAVAERLWDGWLCGGVRRAVEQASSTPEDTRRLFIFLAAAHDIGKATPVFQAKSSAYIPLDLDLRIGESILAAGLPTRPFREFSHPSASPHAFATQLLLRREGVSEQVAAILGAHHGKPASGFSIVNHPIEAHPTNYHMGPIGREAWTSVQRELLQSALQMAGFEAPEKLPVPNLSAQVLLSGLLIMADWIASNERLFPYIRIEDNVRRLDSQARADVAWEKLRLPEPWEISHDWMQPELFYPYRFGVGFDPRPMQLAAPTVALNIYEPGICILEAATGIGKTESALAMSEAFGSRAKRSGVFFALPTQATSDGIFPRVRKWLDALEDGGHAMVLAHGKAQFNEDYRALFEGGRGIYDEDASGAYVHGWFEGPKKALLADFVVGTIDQLLLMALKQKHAMLRHLGLANKVVIIDECHAYDAYMSQYLDMALRWLGAYRVPVIVLSATLPAKRRAALVEAYLNAKKPPSGRRDVLGRGNRAPEQVREWADSRAYPLMTYTDGREIRSAALPDDGSAHEVSIQYIDEEGLADRLCALLADGGCAGVIVNTVRRAQAVARAMRARFGEERVMLQHARFLAPDRARNEEQLRGALGKPTEAKRPSLCVVVGTQVLEQSLDIDFDVLVTDLCPMDLLIQRMGRMHRHDRERPEKLRRALCLILRPTGGGFEEGTEQIYKSYPLMRTQAFLPDHIVLPRDVPGLVQDVYDDDIPPPIEPPGYAQAKEEWLNLTARKERRADAFRIHPPWDGPGNVLTDWLNAGAEELEGGAGLSEQRGEAKVRDSDESFEVLLLIESGGRLRFLPWIEGGREIPEGEIPDRLAQAIARQRLRMPQPLCAPWAIERTIKELEEIHAERFAAWSASPWLKGELILPMDENCTMRLGGYCLRYDRLDGLTYEKEEKRDGG